MHALGTRFQRRDSGRLFYKVWIPGGSLSKRDRKDGSKAVNDISAHEERYSEPGLLYSHALKTVAGIRLSKIDDRSYPARADAFDQIVRERICAGIDLLQLPDLFFKCHLRQKKINGIFGNITAAVGRRQGQDR